MPRNHATPNGPVPFTEEEEREWDQQEAQALAELPMRLAEAVRKQRDEILAQSDWRVTKATESGMPLSADWAAYRQALRDIPQQPGFPETIEWPIKPE